MQAFYYTIVVTTRSQITEVSGVIEERDIEAARAELIKNGYLIRELRPAKQEELALNRLYQFRNKLKEVTHSKTATVQNQFVIPKRRLNWPWILFLLLVVALVILCFVLEQH